MRLDEYGKEY